jgi:hypothetical protein
MNHITEVVHGVKIYDALAYAMFKWRTRLTQWLLDDPRMDESIAEPLQTVNHLCFSPQFYFVCAYYTWGIFHVMTGMVTLIKNNFNPFDDRLFLLIVPFQLFVNRVLDKTIKFMVYELLWQPKSNSIYKSFRATVTVSLRRKDVRAVELEYRNWFLNRHAGWLSGQLEKIFTPRSIDRYRTKLSELYQRTLLLQAPVVYKTPGAPFPEPVGYDELPENLQDELAGSSSEDSDLDKANDGIVVPKSLQRQKFAPSGEAALPYASEGALSNDRLPLVPKAPPAAPVPWPLVAIRNIDEQESGVGIGPLAALVGKAWLETVRRRAKMKLMAEDFAKDIPVKNQCMRCRASDDSDYVKAGVGIWKNGPQLKLTLVRNLDQIIEEFENHFGVPPLKLDQQHWFQWLERQTEDPWETLCVRCRAEHEREKAAGIGKPAALGDFAPLPSISGMSDAAQLPAMPAGPSAGGAFAQLPGISDVSAELPSAPAAEQLGSGGAFAPLPAIEDSGEEAAAIFSDDDSEPALPKAQVSVASREIILYWASLARRRVKAANAQIEAVRTEGRLLATYGEDTPSEGSEEESDEEDEEVASP